MYVDGFVGFLGWTFYAGANGPTSLLADFLVTGRGNPKATQWACFSVLEFQLYIEFSGRRDEIAVAVTSFFILIS